MKKVTTTTKSVVALLVAAAINFTSCTNRLGSKDKDSVSRAETDSLRSMVKELIASKETIAKNLATFDTLDYEVISKQAWIRLHESHSDDVKVHWPDGHMTQGLDVHIEDLKKLFVYAPDTRISQHLIGFGSENYTAVIGIFEGTFTKPMPIGNDKFIQPTGKAFKIPLATIGIWKNGVLIEEHIFSDSQAYVNQIGLGK